MLRAQLICLSLPLAFAQASFADGPTPSKNNGDDISANTASADPGCDDSPAPAANSQLPKNTSADHGTAPVSVLKKSMPGTLKTANPE